MAMIRVKLKRTIYTEYETEVKRGGIKSEGKANKRVVHFSSVVPATPFSERSANQGIVKSEILTQVSKGNYLDDSQRGMFLFFVLGYKIIFVSYITFIFSEIDCPTLIYH